ncbi:nucleotide exchange factor GrpE [bacterium]|nr:nucleotide exchange factor GrpE [bacterium]
MNHDILNSFAGYYLENKVGISSESEIKHELALLQDLEASIFRFIITDKENFDRNERVKKLFNNMKSLINIEVNNTKLLEAALENLASLQTAKVDLDNTISGKKISDSRDLENFPMKTSMLVEREYKLDDLYDYISKQPSNIFSDPKSIFTVVLAKRFSGKDEFSRIKEDLKVDIPDEMLEGFLSKIEGFIPFFVVCQEHKNPDILRDEEEIKTAIDLITDRIDNQKNTLEGYKEEIKKIDREITSNLFDYLGKNMNEFQASNPTILDKAKSIGFILKRLQCPELTDKDLLEEVFSWFPSRLGLTEEGISKVLGEWHLSKPNNIFMMSSERDLFPYKMSRMMIMQDDLFLQELARRELVREMKEEGDYTINRIDITSTDMFVGDFQKLMEVITNFGKQLFKINTFLSRDINKPHVREDIQNKENNLDMNRLELSELSRLIKKFRRDLEDNLQKQSQKEVSLKLLGVVDFFDNLLISIPEGVSVEVKSIKESLQIIYGKLMRILSEYGLTVIECLGERFDPSFHECVDVQSFGSKEPNIIIREIIKGYKMGNEVIRFPKVIVSS